ncbi:MAG TPA: hypothetical protein VGC10_08605 [Sphingomonas sp.]
MKHPRRIAIGFLALLLPLAACHKQPAPAPEPDNSQVEAPPEPPAPPPAPTPPPPVAGPPKAAAPAVKAPPAPTADQQMLDDAAATGMTSHAAGDGDGGNDR